MKSILRHRYRGPRKGRGRAPRSRGRSSPFIRSLFCAPIRSFYTPVDIFDPLGVGEGYDLFILLKSSLVIRPSGGGVKLFEPRRLGEFEAEIEGLWRLLGG